MTPASYYIEKNVAGVRNDLALMVSGESVEAKVQEYAATSMELTTREGINHGIFDSERNL